MLKTASNCRIILIRMKRPPPSQAIDLMPLTTTGGEGSVPDEGAEDNEDASPSQAIALMPLTTTGGEGSVPDEGAGG